MGGKGLRIVLASSWPLESAPNEEGSGSLAFQSPR